MTEHKDIKIYGPLSWILWGVLMGLFIAGAYWEVVTAKYWWPLVHSSLEGDFFHLTPDDNRKIAEYGIAEGTWFWVYLVGGGISLLMALIPERKPRMIWLIPFFAATGWLVYWFLYIVPNTMLWD
jgi:hypothetical protein